MREKLIELLIDEIPIMGGTTFESLADHLIENGVVIPVRCWECKFAREPYIGGLYCQGKHEVDPDHYCRDGKPKEKDEE